MQTRLEALQRLVTLYAAVEEMHSTELQRMTAAVRETEQAIGVERGMVQSARIDRNGALLSGDGMGWTTANSQQEAACWRQQRLEQICLEREELNDAAREQYVASRLKREQIKRVFDDIATRMEIEERRRLQTASDDLFLARRRWTDTKEKISGRVQMKIS